MEKTTFLERLSYAFTQVPAIANSIVGTFLIMLYTDNFGIAAGVAGTIFFISRMFDGVSDLIAGYLIDHTKSKWGKARPWLLWCSVPMGISIALLTMVPTGASETVKVVYAFLTYNLFATVMFTIQGLAANSLMPLMTQDMNDRARIASLSMFVNIGGAILGAATAFPFVMKLGGDLHGWRMAFCIYGAISTVSMLISFLGTKERVVSVEAVVKEKAEKMSFVEELKIFVKNKYLVLGLFCGLMLNFSLNIASAGQTYYYQYVMNDMMLLTSTGLVSLVPTFVSILFITFPMINKFGKKKCVIMGALGQGVGFLLRVLAGIFVNVPMLMAGLVIGGMFTGMMAVPIGTMAADAIDYGEWKTNKRIEGVGSAITSFAQKLTSGVAAGIVGWTLQLTGYVENAVQNSATKGSIIFLNGGASLICMIAIAAMFIFFYRYDEEAPIVVAELERRKAEGTKE